VTQQPVASTLPSTSLTNQPLSLYSQQQPHHYPRQPLSVVNPFAEFGGVMDPLNSSLANIAKSSPLQAPFPSSPYQDTQFLQRQVICLFLIIYRVTQKFPTTSLI
jgi:hypothetical protein